jgi:hypothetical protein
VSAAATFLLRLLSKHEKADIAVSVNETVADAFIQCLLPK